MSRSSRPVIGTGLRSFTSRMTRFWCPATGARAAIACPSGEILMDANCGSLNKVSTDGGSANAGPTASNTSAAIFLISSSPGIGFFGEPGRLDRHCALPGLLAVLGGDGGEYSPAHVEARGEPHEARTRRLNQVVEDLVRHRFVEPALVAERPDVELEALQLDALPVGDVVKVQRR